MKDKIIECAEAFEAIGQLAPSVFTEAKDARFAYEQAKAKAFKAVLEEFAEEHAKWREANAKKPKAEMTPEPKKPTDEAIKAMVILRVAEEQKKARNAEANLESLKMHFQLIRDTLSAYQTAARFEEVGKQFAGAGAYGS